MSSLLVSSIFLAFIYAVLIYEWHKTSLNNKKIIDIVVFIFITFGVFGFSIFNILRYNNQFLEAMVMPIIWVVLIAILTDTGAYFIGRIVGGHRPFLTISPGKTVSGYIGGLICGGFVPVITGMIFQKTLPHIGQVFYLLCIGILLSIGAMAGDLLQSYFKRQNNVKDTGSILPGHGGLFDRFDGILGTSLMLLIIFGCQGIVEKFIS